MRRMEHGWVAKHYPTDQPTSLTNISDDLDDSDGESLDSFFDEEFDDREENEKLRDLLSCNTLGVESKVSLYFIVLGGKGHSCSAEPEQTMSSY